jgi:hypothetical protein
MSCEWHDKIFSVSGAGFEPLALEIFHFQYKNNPVYRGYVNAIKASSPGINSIDEIPFLPISLFKSHEIKSGDFLPGAVFNSSGTSQTGQSTHHVKDISIYTDSFSRTFQKFYGQPSDWCILGLLPSYLERNDSSLVFMVDSLIRQSRHENSGFYLDDFEKLFNVLKLLEEKKQKTILLGVTFALLDFAEKYKLPLNYTTVIETGGMKGRREELTRMEVHDILKKTFSLNDIHSEYGMTELLSQAFSNKDGIFNCPDWMRLLIRDEEDPVKIINPVLSKPAAGAINIIDLANVYSCSFIATDDAGKSFADGSFEVLGRLDGSDLRGCSLLTV